MKSVEDIKKRIAGMRDGQANGREFHALVEDLGLNFHHLDLEMLEKLDELMEEQCKRAGFNHDYVVRLNTMRHFVRGVIKARQPPLAPAESSLPAPTSAH